MTTTLILSVAAASAIGFWIGNRQMKRSLKKNGTVHFKGVPNPTFCDCEECRCRRTSDK